MRALTPSIITVLFFTLVHLISAQSHINRNFHEKRFPSSLQRRHTTHLAKRFSGSFTYYAVGLGSCGSTNVPSDFIVAMNIAQYASSLCFQVITITCNGKTAQATIMDECPGCGYGGLDMSEGLFSFFSDLGAGVITGSWELGSSGNSQPTSTTPTWSSTPQPPTTTSTTPTYTPPPTTSSTPTTTSTSTTSTTPTTTSSPPPTTSSVPSSSLTTTTTSSSVSSTSPTPTDGPDALNAMDTALSGLAQFLLNVL